VQRDRERQRSGDVQQQQAGPAYDFEARDVLVRQMDADGRLQYELEARRFAQSASDGEVVAEGLTIHHDPPGTVPGGPHRWTLTANSAQLPADGRVISMVGEVRANGLPRGRRTPVRIATEQLSYDLTEQEVSSDADYEIRWGGIRAVGSGFSYNIDTGNINAGKQQLQSTDAPPAP
jgi:LPS export ABC transporter protein LptC